MSQIQSLKEKGKGNWPGGETVDLQAPGHQPPSPKTILAKKCHQQSVILILYQPYVSVQTQDPGHLADLQCLTSDIRSVIVTKLALTNRNLA